MAIEQRTDVVNIPPSMLTANADLGSSSIPDPVTSA
jgi:hypothetical protein